MNKKTVIGGLVGIGVLGAIGFAFLSKDDKPIQEKIEVTATPLTGSEGESNIEYTPTPTKMVSQVTKDISWEVTESIKVKGEKDILTDAEYEEMLAYKCKKNVQQVVDAIDSFDFKQYNYREEYKEREGKLELIDISKLNVNNLFKDSDALTLNCDITVVGFKGNKVIASIYDYEKEKDVAYIVMNYDMIGVDANAEEDYKLSIGTEIYPMLLKDYTTVTKVGKLPVIYQ